MLKQFVEAEVDVIVVVAGMEGALASVVSSIADVPVIGVPTSIGYGYGETHGELQLAFIWWLSNSLVCPSFWNSKKLFLLHLFVLVSKMTPR